MWLFDQVPALPANYRIHVAGNEMTVSDLASRSTTLAARLDCTSGWYTDAEWTAVSVAELLSAEEIAAAASIEVVSKTGYRRRFPADEAGSLWLATAYQGVPLRPAYGAPVRLVAPQRRGFWWVKWVASVELSDLPALKQSPFPLQ
jgi:DMSO/TMAO reductase YedYZ molybdopterin-dependent catalytic subunit